MKNYRLLLLALPLLMFSCKDEETPLSERIIGFWDLTSIQRTICADPDLNTDVVPVGSDGCITIDSQTVCDVKLEFKASGIVTASFSEDNEPESDDLGYSVNDETKTVSVCQDINDCSSATVSGNTMTRIELLQGCTVTYIYEKA